MVNYKSNTLSSSEYSIGQNNQPFLSVFTEFFLPFNNLKYYILKDIET